MKKFLVLYRMDMAKMRELMATMSKEDQAKDMAEWKEWMDKNMAHFADHGGAAGKNTQLSPSGAAEIGNDIGGYSIMQGESKDEVIKVLSESPHLKMPGTTTDVMEIVAM